MDLNGFYWAVVSLSSRRISIYEHNSLGSSGKMVVEVAYITFIDHIDY